MRCIISPLSFTFEILLASISLCFAVCYAGYRQLQSRPLTVEIKMANERVPRGGSQLPNNDGRYWLFQNGHDVIAEYIYTVYNFHVIVKAREIMWEGPKIELSGIFLG